MDTGLAILESRKSTTASVLGKIVADISAGDLEQSTIDAFMNDDAAKFLAPRLTVVKSVVNNFICSDVFVQDYAELLQEYFDELDVDSITGDHKQWFSKLKEVFADAAWLNSHVEKRINAVTRSSDPSVGASQKVMAKVSLIQNQLYLSTVYLPTFLCLNMMVPLTSALNFSMSLQKKSKLLEHLPISTMECWSANAVGMQRLIFHSLMKKQTMTMIRSASQWSNSSIISLQTNCSMIFNPNDKAVLSLLALGTFAFAS